MYFILNQCTQIVIGKDYVGVVKETYAYCLGKTPEWFMFDNFKFTKTEIDKNK